MAVHIFQAYIHPKTKNTNYWCETASLKLREMLLNKTFQVQIDSKENHNPDVGCPQYKCKVSFWDPRTEKLVDEDREVRGSLGDTILT